jgi:prefoldin subunit 5
VTVGSLVWAAATITAASATLAGNFNEFKRAVTTQISAVQAQIASLPTQGVRLDQVERGLSEVRQDNAKQASDIGTLQQAQAVLGNTIDSIRHDVQVLQDAANGRLPGRGR